MDEMSSTSFEDKLKARLAKEGKSLEDVVMPGAKKPDKPVELSGFEEDIPDVETELVLSAEEQSIDDAIKSLGILDAYNRWSGKPKVSTSRRGDGIKISCPDPHHKDDDPSAWVNTEKNLYHCGGCEYGGDVWDIAAFHFGYPVPGYKSPELFRELREKVAIDLGFSMVKSVNGYDTVFTMNEEDLEHKEPEVKTVLVDAGEYYDYKGPTIDWRSIVPENTFLREWLEATTKDTCPEEFHFWTGLMSIGYACGKSVVLQDEPDINGNLFVCLTGPTSVGKSKAKRHLKNVLQEYLPYDEDDPTIPGVKIIGAPGSGEYLVKAFQASIDDPSDPKKKIPWPVRGYIDFEEFSSLAAVSNRLGSTLKQGLLDIFDGQKMLVNGSLTHGTRRAINPYGQVISSTQPDAMASFISKEDDTAGFVNRWIFALGAPKQISAWGGVKVDISHAGSELKRIWMWASRDHSLYLSEEALSVWSKFFFDSVLPMKMASEKRSSGILGRIDLILKKLILLFAANKLEGPEVSADTVRTALKLFPYLIGTAGHTETKINRTDDSELADFIVDQIERLKLKNGVDPTKRDIYMACKRKIKTDDQMVRILKNMISLELITETAYKPKTGRPTIRYSVGASTEEKAEEKEEK